MPSATPNLGPGGDSTTAAAAGPGNAEAVDFCALPHRFGFEALPSAPQPTVGLAVVLTYSDPPRLRDDTGKEVGILRDPRASAIQQCLADDYVMQGQIARFDSSRMLGEVDVVGHRG